MDGNNSNNEKMTYNKDNDTIFCHICNEWIERTTGVYIEDTQIRCLKCDIILGYIHDLPEIFDVGE